MANGFKVVCTPGFLLAIIMTANSQQIYYSSQPTSQHYTTPTDSSGYNMNPLACSSYLPSTAQSYSTTLSSPPYPSVTVQSYQSPSASQYSAPSPYPSNPETVTYLSASQTTVQTSTPQYSAPCYPEIVANTITAKAFFLPPAPGSTGAKCKVTYGGQTVEVPCYTYTPSDAVQVPAEEDPKPTSDELIIPPPMAYPCPLCAACQGNTPAPESPLINPPPAPLPVLPGILNQVPSPFPPAKAKPAQVVPVLPSAIQCPCLKPQKSKPKITNGPLIYIPVKDEAKLLEMLIAGLGYN